LVSDDGTRDVVGYKHAEAVEMASLEPACSGGNGESLQDDRSADREAGRPKGDGFARRALEVAGDDPGVLANAAEALANLGEDIGAMVALADRPLVPFLIGLSSQHLEAFTAEGAKVG
jgi:hypothetical protein